MSDYDAVRREVERSGAKTPAEREAVYQALRSQLRDAMDRLRPNLGAIRARPRSLNTAIRRYELDHLAGTIQDWSDETPPDLIDPRTDTVLESVPAAPRLSRLRTLVALTGRTLVLLGRAGPAASVWMVIEPLMQIGIILAIYLLLGHTNIVDMDPLPFAVVGTSAWFMFRMSYIRISNGAIEAALLLIPRIRSIDVLASRALAYGVIYSLAGVGILLVLGALGLGAPVERPLDVFFTWCLILMMGFSLGLIFRTLSGYAPVFQRAVPWTARLFIYTSGVLFVTEQLPDFISGPLLVNPLLHALQHLRSAYFATYESHDVSLAYAAIWTVSMFAGGLILHAGRRAA